MRHAELPMVVLVLALALAVRVPSLSCDPPSWLSWSAGIYSDEGIYSNAARMQVLDRQREPGDFRDSVIAPLQYNLLLFVFRRIGVSLQSVRLVAVAFSMATLAAFWLALRLSYNRTTALAGLVLLGASAPFVLYNRLGLLEMPALFWLTTAFLMLGIADRTAGRPMRMAALCIAGIFAGIAIAWKGTFLLAAVPLLAYAVWRHRAEAVASSVGAAMTLAAYYAIFYLPHRAELGRAARYYVERQYLPHSIAGVGHDLVRGLVTGAGDGVLPYLFRFAPVLLLFTICALLPRVRSKSDICLWSWAMVPIVACLFLNYTPSRYFLMFWPALAGLAACSLVRLPSRRLVTAAALVICVGFNAALLWPAYKARTYTLRDDAATLSALLPRNAWVAGQFAPAMCLDSNIRAIYVQKGLANDEPAALASLPITHVLATRVASPDSDPWESQRENLIADPGGLGCLPVGRRFLVDVYANKEALP